MSGYADTGELCLIVRLWLPRDPVEWVIVQPPPWQVDAEISVACPRSNLCGTHTIETWPDSEYATPVDAANGLLSATTWLLRRGTEETGQLLASTRPGLRPPLTFRGAAQRSSLLARYWRSRYLPWSTITWSPWGHVGSDRLLGTEVGPPTDIYSLGLVLLECLTGEGEYPGLTAETALAGLNRHLGSQTLPTPLATTIEAMTRSDPAQRPDAATCASLLRQQHPPSPPPQSRQITATKIAAGIAGPLAIGGLALATPQTESRTTPSQMQPEQGEVIRSTFEPGTPVMVTQQPTSHRHESPAVPSQQATGVQHIPPSPSSTPADIARADRPQDAPSEKKPKNTKNSRGPDEGPAAKTMTNAHTPRPPHSGAMTQSQRDTGVSAGILAMSQHSPPNDMATSCTHRPDSSRSRARRRNSGR